MLTRGLEGLKLQPKMQGEETMLRSTTIVGVRRNNRVAIAGDGQITLSNTILKRQAKKVQRLYQDKVIAGFAGAVADAQTLFGRFESKLEEFHGNLKRAVVELAKEWRTDRVLRPLEAFLIVADIDQLLVVSGNGEIIEPDDDIVAIGTGGPYALAAAKALVKYSDLDAEGITREAIKIAASICVYTNDQITVEVL